MNLTPEFLEELRSRISVSEVVGRRVQLQKHGREHKGLCPFHNEKSPSFTVVDDKNFYHCFGCGAHGDVITFVMETEGLAFPEAVERLAAQAGLEVPKPTVEDRQRAEQAKTLGGVVEAACVWYQQNLASADGAGARAYLTQRGLRSKTIANFRIGYAPARRGALLSALRQQGFETQLLVDAGLLKQAENGDGLYDYFRDRVMFPITDRTGRVIAFGGRILGDGQPKYLNSPDNPLFHKGRVLYGLAQARDAARKANRVVVCEGYMDVIALYQAGIAEAVAPLGTALTEEQIQVLWRLAAEPVICFDGDTAGNRAAVRASARALPMLKPGHSLRFTSLPEGQDPDDFISRNGVEAMQARLRDATAFVDFLWSQEYASAPVDTPERMADFHMRLRSRIKGIADGGVRAAYQDVIEGRIQAERDLARGQRRGGNDRFSGPRRSSDRGQKGVFGRAIGDPSIKQAVERRLSSAAQALLLKVILNHPGLIDEFGEALGYTVLSDQNLDKLRQEILDIAGQDPDLDSDGLKARLAERGHRHISGILSSGHDLKAVAFANPSAPFDKARTGLVDLLSNVRVSELDDRLTEVGVNLAETLDEDDWARFLLFKQQEMQVRSQIDD